MKMLIPYDDTDRARAALAKACSVVMPGDEVIVVVTIVVPDDLPLDIPAGYVWKQSCRAERSLLHACDEAESSGALTQFVCIRARSRADAIIGAAAEYRADVIIFAEPRHLLGRLAPHVGAIATVSRYAPCRVSIITQSVPAIRHPTATPNAMRRPAPARSESIFDGHGGRQRA